MSHAKLFERLGIVGGLVFGLSAAGPAAAPAAAQPAKLEQRESRAPSAPSESPEFDEWRTSLDEATDRLAKARESLEQAEYTWQDWRQRKYPRGARRAELLATLEAARVELAEAEKELPKLLEAARRAGVPPGVLRNYEVRQN